MAQPQQNIRIAAPGFAGLNTESSPVQQGEHFAAIADNCVIDKYGRLAARKGLTESTTTPHADLTGFAVERLFEFTANDGTTETFFTANNEIFKDIVTPVKITPAAYTITANQWQIAQLNDHVYFFQIDHEPLVYTHSSGLIVAMSAHASAGALRPEANTVAAAYGRIWCADITGDKQTLYWSDLLIGMNFNTGTSGSADLQEAWPDGSDEIVAIAQHNNLLLVFGENSILVYTGADDDPTNNMVLSDTIKGIGCAARNSVHAVGNDIYFLDSTGVRSLGRTIQEKSLPIGDISKNIRTELREVAAAETTGAHAVYSGENSFYILGFHDSGVYYCFDTANPLEDGSARVTKWTGVTTHAIARFRNGDIYFGGLGSVFKYSGYVDAVTPYTLRWFSSPLDFDEPAREKLPKQVDYTIIGGAGYTATVSWGFDYSTTYRTALFSIPASSTLAEYGVSEYADFGDAEAVEYGASVNLTRRNKNLGGSGRAVTLGISVDINGSPFSIQELNLQALLGRII